MPRFSHAWYDGRERLRMEFLKGDEDFRATIWIYWTWRSKAHRLLVSLPDFV